MTLSAGAILAVATNPIEHIADRPWVTMPKIWGGYVLSSHIVTMILAGVLLSVLLLAAARRRAIRPAGKGYNLVEALVLFVRDFIARPALHGQAYRFLPFLLTLFTFILMCNLLGLIPLADLSHGLAAAAPAVKDYPFGGTATSGIYVTAALAGMTLLLVIGAGIATQVQHFVQEGHSPAAGWLAGFFLYLWSLVPPMPGRIKLIMAPLLIILEFVGVIAKCFALCIRLLANMSAGHVLLAVLLMFISMGSGWIGWVVVTPVSIAGSVAISLLELLVAVIQAYIFTFLTALFIGMAVHPHH